MKKDKPISTDDFQSLEGRVKKTEEALLKLKSVSAIESNIEILKNLGDQIPELNKKLSDITSQLPEINQMLEDVNTKLPEVQKQMDNIEQLGAQIPEIQQKMQTLDKNIDDLQDRIDQIGGGGGENWVVIYDRDDPDEKINLGYPKGIRGGTYTINNLPNLSSYKKFRFYFNLAGFAYVFYADWPLKKSNIVCFYTNDTAGINMTNVTIAFLYNADDDTLSVYFPSILTVQFPSSKYPVQLSRNDNSAFYFFKIEASV